eukprot:GHVR01155684.1.p1 GENE.GHVR01155684.1~~GHVR01155684.1.p1  ORF type:complete len:108 (-),score=10.69 GHVR01155684.1:17-340(-)
MQYLQHMELHCIKPNTIDSLNMQHLHEIVGESLLVSLHGFVVNLRLPGGIHGCYMCRLFFYDYYYLFIFLLKIKHDILSMYIYILSIYIAIHILNVMLHIYIRKYIL